MDISMQHYDVLLSGQEAPRCGSRDAEESALRLGCSSEWFKPLRESDETGGLPLGVWSCANTVQIMRLSFRGEAAGPPTTPPRRSFLPPPRCTGPSRTPISECTGMRPRCGN